MNATRSSEGGLENFLCWSLRNARKNARTQDFRIFLKEKFRCSTSGKELPSQFPWLAGFSRYLNRLVLLHQWEIFCCMFLALVHLTLYVFLAHQGKLIRCRTLHILGIVLFHLGLAKFIPMCSFQNMGHYLMVPSFVM